MHPTVTLSATKLTTSIPREQCGERSQYQATSSLYEPVPSLRTSVTCTYTLPLILCQAALPSYYIISLVTLSIELQAFLLRNTSALYACSR